MFIYRKISGKQVGQTANTVLPVLCMCCVLLMGLPAGVSLLSHQNTLADAVAVLRHAGSGDNCRGEHCSPASLTKLLLFRNDYLRKKVGAHTAHSYKAVIRHSNCKCCPPTLYCSDAFFNKGQYRIILSADTASEVRQLPEWCLSRQAGIVRCCHR